MSEILYTWANIHALKGSCCCRHYKASHQSKTQSKNQLIFKSIYGPVQVLHQPNIYSECMGHPHALANLLSPE